MTRTDWSIVIVSVLLMIVAVAGVRCQEYPNSPGTAQRPCATCNRDPGYSWWDIGQPQMTYKQTISDPLFYVPLLAMVGTNLADAAVASSSDCGERHEFGRHKSFGEYMATDIPADAAVATLAFFLHKSHVRIIPQGMMGYAIFVHSRGLVNGARCQ